MDIKQALDRVWRPVTQEVDIFESYLQNQYFYVHCGTSTSSNQTIAAGVPQGSVVGSLLYVLFIADIPIPPVSIATIADNIAVLYTHESHETVTSNLHQTMTMISDWMRPCGYQLIILMVKLSLAPPVQSI